MYYRHIVYMGVSASICQLVVRTALLFLVLSPEIGPYHLILYHLETVFV